MTRAEFLSKLQDALSAELDAGAVERNVRYYDEYISDEIKSGKSERDVLDSLGDPWVIARSIIDAPGNMYQNESVFETVQHEKQGKSHADRGAKIFFFDKWWHKALLILVMIFILIVVVSVITGLLAIAARVALPVIMVLLIVNFVRKHR